MSKIWRTGLPLKFWLAWIAGLLPLFLFSTAGADNLIVPLTRAQGWQVLTFKKIPGHKVQFTEQGLSIDVQKSAGPIVYKFPGARPVSGLVVRGQVTGGLKLKPKIQQGDKGQDDFLLRVGLVRSGDKKLKFWQKAIAPDWLLKLHGLAAKNEGVDRIDFFNLTSDPRLLGTERRHPLSDLLYEHNVWAVKDSTFELSQKLSDGPPVVGLWLSADGDDTQSAFQILLQSLILE